MGMEEKRDQVIFLGARHSDATSDAPPHAHDFYELNFMTRGNTKMRRSSSTIPMTLC